jgi:membrane protein CcdC involved in cytochrome C biogenesis
MSLKKIIFVRNRIDPDKISGPYSLFALMLLVAEILFAIWFCKAESSLERSIAGSIMAAVFMSLMLIVVRMNQTPDKEKKRN